MEYEKHFEDIMTRVAYLYFACKTAGLLILVDFFMFKRPQVTLFAAIVAGCYYVNLKLFKRFEHYLKREKIFEASHAGYLALWRYLLRV